MKRIPISQRSLAQRIQRALARHEPRARRLVTAHPGSLAEQKVGRYSIVDISGVVATHQDLETLARDLGVLADWEYLAE